ncbi:MULTISPECIES: hypothetical protein [unclassified Streptomyces]|uniref:Uncharacterized protein n=1 Tax=Streptomyces sp. R33 TaxID=3238629 RepID=A0AB39Y058_9ACTN|nr:hypothetical protein [Streptomyces sp. XY332]
MIPTPPSVPVECIRIRDARTGTGHPHHPAYYEIVDPQEIAEVLAVWPDEPAATGTHEPSDPGIKFLSCMCWEHEPGGSDDPRIRELPNVMRPQPLAQLLDSRAADGIPARHRARWAAAAPGGLRGYAEAMARGEEPEPPAGIALSVAFAWQGAARENPADAASLLADAAPQRLLTGAGTAELAWAVRETDRGGLDAAVRFFASEEFTTRHPKRRRVPDTARDLLLRHARSHRPTDLPVLERRLLRTPDDRVRRS